jgi:Glycosyltransferase family 87
VRPVWVVLAVVELGILLAIAAPKNPDKPGRAGGIRTAAAQLRGSGPPVDLVQDYVGARDVAHGREAYPVLTRAYASVGLAWPAGHRSTHPPSAFLLVLPVAWLSWKAAAAVWMVLMLAALAGAYWALGAAPGPAVALAPLTLVWPPGGWSMGQLTPLWLLGLALAWRLRDRPAGAGAAIALASLTKLVPALSLLPFLLLRRWSVLRGFAVVWGAAVALLLVLDPGVIGRYLTIVRTVSREQAERGENSALLWAAAHNYGAAGVAVGVLLVAAVLALVLRRVRRRGEIDRLSWDGVGWAGVALLPIAWIYSLLPLLPALARLVRRGGLLAAALALVTFVIPFLVDPFGLPGGIRLAFATAALGVSLLVASRHAASHAASGPSAASANRGSSSAPASSSSSATAT